MPGAWSQMDGKDEMVAKMADRVLMELMSREEAVRVHDPDDEDNRTRSQPTPVLSFVEGAEGTATLCPVDHDLIEHDAADTAAVDVALEMGLSPTRERLETTPTDFFANVTVFASMVGLIRIVGGGDWALPIIGSTLVATLATFVGRREQWTRAKTLGAVTTASLCWLMLSTLRTPLAEGTFTESVAGIASDIRVAMFLSKAPVVASVGVMIGLGMIAAATVWATDTLRGSKAQILPAVSLFLFGTLSGSDLYAPFISALFVSCVFGWLAARQYPEGMPSLGGNPAARYARTAVAFIAVAVIAGVVVGPRLPGADSPGMISWFGNRSGPVRISPLVDIGGRIQTQSTVTMFSVEGEAASYWRLSSLDEFDGKSWFRSGAPISMTGDESSHYHGLVTYEFKMNDLDSAWLPTAPNPVIRDSAATTIDFHTGELSYAYQSSPLGVKGMDYKVTSAKPYTPGEMANAVSDSSASMDLYRKVPDGFSTSEAASKARDIVNTSPGGSDYKKLTALQNWFRDSFQYNLQADFTHYSDPIGMFLKERSGYCQQFAGTFAAMARSLGYATRVAVGFTAGAPAGNNKWEVTGTDAHAWPEVWFGGDYGWVSFEPTPARVLNQPTFAPMSAAVPPVDSSSPPTTTATTSSSTVEVAAGEVPPPAVIAPTMNFHTEGILALVGLIGFALTVDRTCRRWRTRRRSSLSDTERIEGAWKDCLAVCAGSKLAKAASETPTGWAARMVSVVGPGAVMLDELAAAIEAHIYGDVPYTADIADLADRVRAKFVPSAMNSPKRRDRKQLLSPFSSVAPGEFKVIQQPT